MQRCAVSYGYFKPIKSMPPTEFKRNVIETLHSWLEETVGKPDSPANDC